MTKKFVKTKRTKEMEHDLKNWISTSKGDKKDFIKKWGMSPSYMMTMYKPYMEKYKKKLNPKWHEPTIRYINGERFYSTGIRYKKKSDAQSYAELMREKGHKARVIQRKGLSGGKEYVVIRDKF